MQSELTGRDDRLLLRITCPAPRKALPVFLCAVVLSTLAWIVVGQWAAKSGGFLWLLLWGAVLIATGPVAILYRNLCFRDQLLINKSGKPLPNALAVDEILAVHVRPAPLAGSHEDRLARLGLAEGRIEIHMANQRVRFGAGLHEFMVDETADRIARFCSGSALK